MGGLNQRHNLLAKTQSYCAHAVGMQIDTVLPRSLGIAVGALMRRGNLQHAAACRDTGSRLFRSSRRRRRSCCCRPCSLGRRAQRRAAGPLLVAHEGLSSSDCVWKKKKKSSVLVPRAWRRRRASEPWRGCLPCCSWRQLSRDARHLMMRRFARQPNEAKQGNNRLLLHLLSSLIAPTVQMLLSSFHCPLPFHVAPKFIYLFVQIYLYFFLFPHARAWTALMTLRHRRPQRLLLRQTPSGNGHRWQRPAAPSKCSTGEIVFHHHHQKKKA